MSAMLPPHDLDAEKALLGLVLADPSCDFDTLAKMPPEAMYSEAHSRSWKAFRDIVQTGRVPDMVQLRAQIRKNGDSSVVDENILRSFLPEEAGFSYGQATEYARIITDAAKKRALIAALHKSLAIGMAGELDAEEFIRRTQGEIEAASKLEASEFSPRFVQDVIKEDLAELARSGNVEEPIAVCGVEAIDKTIRVCEGHLVFIGARPGMGKSALAEHYATATGDALFCSLEMPGREYGRRTMAHASGVPFLRAVARMGEFGPRFSAGFDSIRKRNIIVVDQPSITIAELRAHIREARRMLAEKGRKLKLVVVDYLQLMSATSQRKGGTRSEEVGALTKALKDIAKREKIAIIVLAQLNRAAEKDDRPTIAHLRESGDCEQDADKVILLYRQNYYDKKDIGDVEPAEIIVGKDRQGRPGVVHAGWRGEVTSFVDLETEEYA